MTDQEITASIPLEEIVEWAAHPTSVKVLKYLKKCQESLETQLHQGATLSLTSCEAVALSTNYLLGEIKGSDMIHQIIDESKEALAAKEAEEENKDD